MNDIFMRVNDQTINEALKQRTSTILVFMDGSNPDKPLEDAMARAARKHSDDLQILEVDPNQAAATYSRYGQPKTPALVTLTSRGKEHSRAEHIRPRNLRDHIDHLLHDKPLPQPQKTQQKSGNGNNKVSHVNDKTFRREVLNSKQPVLVDFWAEWCGPCRQIAPYVDQLAKEYAGQLKVVKLNVDKNQSTAEKYKVRGIPTFIVFKNGQPVERTSGATPHKVQRLAKLAVE